MHIPNVLSAWILRAHDALVDAAAREAGLDPRELAALTLIASHADCSVGWLHQRIGLTQSGTVRLVDRLQRAGLVGRSRSSGRGVALTVTAEAAKRLGRWQESRERLVDELLDGLDARDRASLADSLARALARQPRERSEADAACRTCDWPACGEECPVDRSVPPR
jgi:DNA-binding MarR family transcriptional regulator